MSTLRLESFEAEEVAPDRVDPAKTELEEARLAAFESGYSAGWDDAVSAQDTTAAQMRSQLAQHFQDMSFTFHEARVHVLRSVEPLIATILEKVLPDLARASLVPRIQEMIQPALETLSDSPITISLHPETRRLADALLRGDQAVPLRIVEDETLTPGQAHLSLARTEQRIDLDGVVDAIRGAVAGFFMTLEEKKPDGTE